MPIVRNSLFVLALISLSGCQSMQGVNSHDTNQTANNYVKTLLENQSGVQSALLLAPLANASGLKFSQANEDHAQQVLENNFTKQKSEWIDELNKMVLTVTPTRTFVQSSLHCRDYRSTITQAKREVAVNANACRQNNGIWIIQ
jgi:surface antigen